MSTSGRYLRALVAGSPVKGVRSWDAQPNGDTRLDASDSDSAPYTDSDAGMYGVRITVNGIWDPAYDGAFPGFLQGAIVVNTTCFANRTNVTPDYLIPLGIVTEDAQTTEVRGQIVYRFTVENKGIYYRHGIAAAVS